MDLKKKKVCEYFFWKLRIVLVELYNNYWPWKKTGEEVDPDHKIREKEWKTRDAPWLNHKKQQKVFWKKLERTQRLRVDELERFAFDPKSVEKFGCILE